MMFARFATPRKFELLPQPWNAALRYSAEPSLDVAMKRISIFELGKQFWCKGGRWVLYRSDGCSDPLDELVRV